MANGAKFLSEPGELARVDQRRGQSEAAFEANFERHHVRFAQRIDGRIGDLRETLLAVIPQRARQSGQKRGRSVIAHAPVGFFAMHQRGEKHFVLVFGPAGGGGEAFWFSDGGGRHAWRWSAIAERPMADGRAIYLRSEAFQNVAPAQEES